MVEWWNHLDSRFKRLISVCCLLGDKFVPPNANKIGGPLLDLNFKMTMSVTRRSY